METWNNDKITKEKIEECKDLFNEYYEKNDPINLRKKLGEMFRKLGAYVPNDKLEKYIEDNGDDCIKLEKFLFFFAENYTKKADKQELINGFAFLDQDKTGFINASDLKHSLTSIGDKLTEDEVDELLKNYTDKNGLIDYKVFATQIAK